MKISNMVTAVGKTSAFKADEIHLLPYKQVVTTELVPRILERYFPSITSGITDTAMWARWSGRPRLLFECLVGPLVSKMLELRSVAALRKHLLENERDYFQDAVNLLLTYIRAFSKRPYVSKTGAVNATPLALLQRVYHDLVFQDRYPWGFGLKALSTLIDAGLVFCESGVARKLTISQGEPSFFRALTQFYHELSNGDVTKVRQIPVALCLCVVLSCLLLLEARQQRVWSCLFRTLTSSAVQDPLVSALMDKLRLQGHGSDAVFEDLVMRLIQLLVNANGLSSLFGSSDQTLAWYDIASDVFWSRNTSAFISSLAQGVTQGILPPTTALPDGILPLRKKPLNKLPRGTDQAAYDQAPAIRLLVVQVKFYVISNLTQAQKDYAMQTTDLLQLYQRKCKKDDDEEAKKSKDTQGRREVCGCSRQLASALLLYKPIVTQIALTVFWSSTQAMALLAHKPEMRDWSLRAVFISDTAGKQGDAPEHEEASHMIKRFVYIGSNFFPKPVQDLLGRETNKAKQLLRERAERLLQHVLSLNPDDAAFAAEFDEALNGGLFKLTMLNALHVPELADLLAFLKKVGIKSKQPKKRKRKEDLVDQVYQLFGNKRDCPR